MINFQKFGNKNISHTDKARELEGIKTSIDSADLPDIDKSDIWAMLISGFITIGLPCIAAIGIIVAITLLLFG